ncbi:MAG: hypothetical protein II893_07050 [Methanomicrobium sp.]|nr:hypothetical protein [Methanomicrobium sp.]
MKRRSLDTVKGANFEEKMNNLSIAVGKPTDVMELIKIKRLYGIEVVLYFEPELADKSTYEKDLVDFAADDEFERPFIAADRFVEFGKENDPTFESRLKEFPLMVTVHSFGERKTESGTPVKYIKALMPFLDEFDVNKDIGPVIS